MNYILDFIEHMGRSPANRTIPIDFRHTCEQGENMAGYGWEEYDVRDGGRQIIHDSDNKVDITTEFVKFPGGHHGGSWGVRVRGTPRDDAPAQLMSAVIFYTAMEGFGSLEVANEKDDLGIEGTVTLNGQSTELGDFKIDVTEGPSTNMHPPATHDSYAEKPLDRTMVSSFQVPEEAIWQTKRTLAHFVKCCGCRKPWRFVWTITDLRDSPAVYPYERACR